MSTLYFLIGAFGVHGCGLGLAAETVLRICLTGFGLNLGAPGRVWLFMLLVLSGFCGQSAKSFGALDKLTMSRVHSEIACFTWIAPEFFEFGP